ncbi:unnamed protein product [Coffea canephora]|uniref:Core Histone H2A/H2B/H3 domain-containing protein n=1 Tax=Coffea canephora TaxID=49390 RepID=A0A068UH90_COFCA|nr:unnamed protein product [Coffea canephora]
MAPPKTRSGKLFGTVVTKKVIEETVQVVVSPKPTELETNCENNDERVVEVVASSTKENEKIEVISSPLKEPVRRTIVVEDRAKGAEQEEQQQKGQEAQRDDQDETQQASEPETPPTPPPNYEAGPNIEQQRDDQERQPRQADVDVAREGTKKRKTSPGIEDSTNGKKEKKAADTQRRRKRAKMGSGGGTNVGFKRYVLRVMKQVHPECAISSKAMTIVNNLMSDMFERIAEEASRLSRYSWRRTLSSWEIQDAVKLVLPGELGKHAIAEGSKAVRTYASSVSGQSKKSKS